MKRLLIAGLKQETSSFNPVLTRRDSFQICRGEEMRASLRGTNTEIAGGLDVFEADDQVEVLPALAAWSGSGGPVHQEDLDRLGDELLESVRALVGSDAAGVDGAYIAFHGAMAGEREPDPEGWILEEIRHLLGDRPIAISLDLHAIITDRLVRCADALVPFHTYPHTDQRDTGQRAARLLLRMARGEVVPATARLPLPMLVRGDELLTATGRFGEAIEMCREIESSEGGLAAGVVIGNPFTDVPELQSNVVVTTDGDPDRSRREAERIARFMWRYRELFVAELTSLDKAIDIAAGTNGLTVFSDAADATSSGASGDSNAVLKGFLGTPFDGTVLLTIVDAAAVARAHAAGVGAQLALALGGTLDPGRHAPVMLQIRVVSLSDGHFTYEEGTTARPGRTAVLMLDRIRILATEQPVHVMGRRLFLANGLDPAEFDVVVLKSPNGFRTHYEEIASRIVSVDVPGSTSANLHSLPYRHCVRPIFPLDPAEEIELQFAAEE